MAVSTPQLRLNRRAGKNTSPCKILNIQNKFDVEELKKVRQRPPWPEMANFPSEKEYLSAVVKLKNRKAGGESGILPEMVKMACSEDEHVSKLLELVLDVWRKCKVSSEWCDAIFLPIPKMGDLSIKCNN